ncbi:hypothetical protein QQ045_028144 [Rhodiola kirilowii]
MRDGTEKKSKVSWTKSLVKKWFNIKSKTEGFQADYDDTYNGVDEAWRNNFTETEACTTIRKSKTDRARRRRPESRGKIDLEASQVTEIHNYRIFVATWNVAGKPPPSHLSLEDWLHTSPPADIYVLGFQEIVPLNAGNVLGTEDNGPARRWLALIRKTLNSLPGSSGGVFHTPSPIPDPIVELDSDFEGSTRPKASSFFHRRSFQSLSRSMRVDNDTVMPQPRLDRRLSVCDRVMYGNRPSDFDPSFKWGSSDDENEQSSSPYTSAAHYSPMSHYGASSTELRGHSRYSLVASKQMVGIFLTVWVKGELKDHVHSMKVSCIGRGLMGYLGNKGSISISMAVHQTSFCFICCHLTSGQKEGDELRRNSDVMEILRKTRFPRVYGMGDDTSPQTVFDHDRIIWLGDLNYRIALSYRSAKALVEMRNWKTLLDKDQLRMEQRQGRVFEGWNEGKIYFPPTYKYSNNSDRYAGDTVRRKEKRRTPAWCDRILWYGQGLRQLSYVRGESKFSDHRPVYSLFLGEVECIDHGRIRRSTSYSSSRVEVEELLANSYRYTDRDPSYY